MHRCPKWSLEGDLVQGQMTLFWSENYNLYLLVNLYIFI